MINFLQSGRLWTRPLKRADQCTYMAFVDLEKAYDDVNRLKLWKVLEEYGVK